MGAKLHSGATAGFPYSLSRWTDVSGSKDKWAWFREQLAQGYMMAFNPTTGVPQRWSLAPEDTLGLIFWTREPGNLIRDAALLAPYKVKIHMTVTGWHEVERGAPGLVEGSIWLTMLAHAYGPENVTWRFSPVPMVPDVEERFAQILQSASQSHIRSVYMSFLQPNDRIPETRSPEERLALLGRLAEMAQAVGVEVLLCNEDRLLATGNTHENLFSGVCAPPEDFQLGGRGKPASEGCGCVYMADPFSINESCSFGCLYCYVSDKGTAKNKRNTTKQLPQFREAP
jgi:hypothetical protein